MTPILSENKMEVKSIGGVSIFRPRLESEQLARNEAVKYLREGYSSGTYSDSKKINEILQYQFGHFYRLLKVEIQKTSSRHLMEFLLGQYDITAIVLEKQKKGSLNADDQEYWARHGPIIRRALKHLAEVVAGLAPPEAPTLDPAALLLNLDTIVICGEMLVELYILSDQTHGLHPNDSTLKIHPEGGLDYLSITVKDFERYNEFPHRIDDNASRQSKYLARKPLRFDLDFQAMELDSTFKSEFGFTYKQGIQALQQLIDKVIVPDSKSFNVPFVRRESMIDGVVQLTGVKRTLVERFIKGFSLTKAQLEGRLIYKPKQEYRALRRGFFEMPHKTGPHLVWSRCMARECLLELMKGTLFQRCPSEWKSVSINKAFATLQNKGGNWFEAEVARNMIALGAQGKASLKGGIGIGPDRVIIPSEIGEIDYLGFFPAEGLLTLLEDKMVDGGFEPNYFRDDISSFVTDKKPYVHQLKRKVEWVRNNLVAVCRGLSSLLDEKPVINPTRVAGALVTLHPTYASYFISDYPCIPLTELMEDFNAKGAWPYAVGVKQVP